MNLLLCVPAPHLLRRHRLTWDPGGCAEYNLVSNAEDDTPNGDGKDKPASQNSDGDDDDESDNGSGSTHSPLTPSSLETFGDAFASTSQQPQQSSYHVNYHAGSTQHPQQYKSTGLSELRIVTSSSPVSIKAEDMSPAAEFTTAPFLPSHTHSHAAHAHLPAHGHGQPHHGGFPAYAVPRSYANAPAVPSPLSSPGVVLAPDLSFNSHASNSTAGLYNPLVATMPSMSSMSSMSPEPIARSYSDAHAHAQHQQRQSQHVPQIPHRATSANPSAGSSSAAFTSAGAANPTAQPNRLVGVSVWSGSGSTPLCSLPSDAMTHDTARAAVRIQITHSNSPSSATENIVPAVYLAGPWSRSAVCSTTITSNGQAMNPTCFPLTPSPSNMPGSPVMVCLPDPWQQFSQWLDYGATIVSYKVDVDGSPFALIHFELLRSSASSSSGSSNTSAQAELLDMRTYAADGSPRWSPIPMPSPVLPDVGSSHAQFNLNANVPRSATNHMHLPTGTYNTTAGLPAFGQYC
jgi:hypothetical protein